MPTTTRTSVTPMKTNAFLALLVFAAPLATVNLDAAPILLSTSPASTERPTAPSRTDGTSVAALCCHQLLAAPFAAILAAVAYLPC